MQLYKGIVRPDIWSEDLSVRPDDQNTLTRQSAITNKSHRYPFLGLITHPRTL